MGSRLAGQVLFYAALMLLVGYFSARPVYSFFPEDAAMLKVSVNHKGQPIGECYERSDEELAKLPPNMRIRTVCPRERSPVYLAVDVDGRTIFEREQPPSGLSRDGRSYIYWRAPLPAGPHELYVRMRDRAGVDGFPYELRTRVELRPLQVVVIDFDEKDQRLTLR